MNEGRRHWRFLAIAAIGSVAIGWSDDIARDRATGARGRAEVVHPAPSHVRHAVRGVDFPEGLLSLTWDDGPDVGTVALARYLQEQSVGATFFVVGEWLEGVSDDPGVGPGALATGYAHLPVLGELVRLGHRVGGHTRNHVLLADAPIATVTEQILRTTHDLDPFVAGETRMFRAPGGAWSDNATSALQDPFLGTLIGPVRWDIDAKDWDGSLHCRSSPPGECEPGPVGPRVKPAVIASRYVAQIETYHRGIVLLHDRVGAVGSSYALDVARALVPELRARGYVFGPPILAFSPLEDRLVSARLAEPGATPASAVLADIDGDGKADLCEQSGNAIRCARADVRRSAATMPRAVFEVPKEITRLPEDARGSALGDVDGDGRADFCVLDGGGLVCATDAAHKELRRWSSDAIEGNPSSLRLADIDGDGRADACLESERGVVCQTSDGVRFRRPVVWSTHAPPPGTEPSELADVDGDHRADLCARTVHGVDCALSSGHAFGAFTRWSASEDFAGTVARSEHGHGRLLLGDLNGDGRADACVAEADGVRCALSRGRGFLRATVWSDTHAGTVRLADVNGDGRADLCAIGRDRITCGMAP